MNTRILDVNALRETIVAGGVPFKQNAGSYIFACPRCLKRDKLYVRKRDGRFKCFYCAEVQGFSGWADWALAELLGRPQPELRALLYGDIVGQGTESFTVQLKDPWADEEDEILEESADDLVEVCWSPDIVDLDHGLAQKGVRYLESRGIDLDLARQYKLRYDVPSKRVVFPCWVGGRLYGWQSRYVDQTTVVDLEQSRVKQIPKMLTQGQIGGKILMFQDRLIGSHHAVLVEGPIDAIKCHDCGGNVAAMGKGVSTRQLEIISRMGIRKLYVGLDPDASQDIMRIVRQAETLGMTCFRLNPPPGRQDLGDATLAEVRHQFDQAPRIDTTSLFVFLK
jgi:hypothetical protein